jgi:hypothetical protein
MKKSHSRFSLFDSLGILRSSSFGCGVAAAFSQMCKQQKKAIFTIAKMAFSNRRTKPDKQKTARSAARGS